MNTVASATRSNASVTTGVLLMAGIVLATLTEAIASTVLALGRSDIIGDTYATPDEFAWLDVGYIAFKLIGFMTAPWLLKRFNSRHVMISSTLVMGLACGIAAITARLDLLIALRVIQGFAGGTLLVGGRRSSFALFRGPFSQSSRLCLPWVPLSRPRRSPRRFKDG